MKNVCVLSLICSLTACFTYVPVGTTFPELGQDVRVHLSPTQAIDLGSITVQDVTRVDGTVYSMDGDSLAIWSQWFRTRSADRHFANGHIHVVPRTQASNLEVRRLHVARTVLATAGVIAAGTAVFAFTADLGGGGIAENGNGGTQTSLAGLIPILSIPIP